MAFFVNDCPRCGAHQITFDVLGATGTDGAEAQFFSVCRACRKSSVFVARPRNTEARSGFSAAVGIRNDTRIETYYHVREYVSLKHQSRLRPPDLLPENVTVAFIEGATCFAVECFNAAGTMFRLCVDLVTKPLLPDPLDTDVDQPNSRTRRDLGLRLRWLFEHSALPEDLSDLASCIREDGNDGAHAGTLTRSDVEDLIDFTTTLLERLVTEPRKVQLAKVRRDQRRSQPTPE